MTPAAGDYFLTADELRALRQMVDQVALLGSLMPEDVTLHRVHAPGLNAAVANIFGELVRVQGVMSDRRMSGVYVDLNPQARQYPASLDEVDLLESVCDLVGLLSSMLPSARLADVYARGFGEFLLRVQGMLEEVCDAIEGRAAAARAFAEGVAA